RLGRVRVRRTVVGVVVDSIPVPVGQLAGVTHTVGVAIGLAGVGSQGAVVAGVAHAVAVRVGLARVAHTGAVVDHARHAVPVPVGTGCSVLVDVRDARAVVASIAHSVAIPVGLGWIAHARAVVEGFNGPIAVRVCARCEALVAVG